jgi:adenine deaminase
MDNTEHLNDAANTYVFAIKPDGKITCNNSDLVFVTEQTNMHIDDVIFNGNLLTTKYRATYTGDDDEFYYATQNDDDKIPLEIVLDAIKAFESGMTEYSVTK